MNNLKSTITTTPPHTPEPLPDFKAPVFKDGALVLYFHPYNFYSQKVLLMLYEKNLEFTPYALDLSNGEQYSSWFLNINPKGDVPVLQDGPFIIPDSRHIMNYVEDKFRSDKHQAFKSYNFTAKEYEKLQRFDKLLAQVPVGALSLGSFIHEDLKLAPKPPFIGPVRKACIKNNEKVYELLKKSIEEAEVNKAALLRKLEIQDQRRRVVYSRVEFHKILDNVYNVLYTIETDLKENPDREWLITDKLTLTDIAFGLLLHRLYQLGFENYYWGYGKLPHVESFFLRFRKRESYQKLVPTNFEILKDMWQKTPSNYKIGAGAGVLGMAMFAAFAHK
ncbi:ganglioside-induced differentiation-associated protein 1 [Teleopsis dalmanni]|uniref:ganglioside-induced differentiation-associated protein 1 n=1 Tax=Teleopsis dalmanni TaxID=139649 RepID=UPI0018CFEE33|nr:ganglioside-induced differentiation-associated protein 1 [Teleopsis dalmanni]